jgi:flagellar basal body-associated protein FliL
MKRCPKCSRSFPDDNQKFCTIDGGLLVLVDKPFDPNATIQGSANLSIPIERPGEKPDSHPLPDFDETIAASAPTVVFPKQTGPTGSPTAPNLPPPPSVSPPPPPSASFPPAQSAQSKPQNVPLSPAQSAPAAPVAVAPPKKKSKLPIILGVLALLFVLGVGVVVAAFFLVIKPRLDQMKTETPIVERTNQNENTNPSTNSNTEEPKTESAKTETEFVAPPNTTRFENSEANLDGKLAEHYVDFSFYYPDTWVTDPKAGVPGASNFVKVQKTLEDNSGSYLIENATVSWYTSNGTFESDLPGFPERAKNFSSQMAGSLPGYEKVSEGTTQINSLNGYEFRFQGVFQKTGKGDLPYWGRTIFLPPGSEGNKNGVVIVMLSTSLAPEASGVEDVGQKGEMPVILESFRLGKGR